jgi:hypothetical protein
MEKLIQLQSQLAEIQNAVIEQNGLIEVYRKRISELESHERERLRYELCKLGTIGDFMAYRMRPSAELTERVDEPPHFLCQPCFDAGKKVVLKGNGDNFWKCPVCGNGAQVGVSVVAEKAAAFNASQSGRRMRWE